jgi:cellulose synthase/poly-beta-1,6-N-acetylglucosamine synthase-like glycosyltransferase/spore germination protein YaaH/peptidoglycan/xylan/chitin deacetylase (PgdA/CDA1 family)
MSAKQVFQTSSSLRWRAAKWVSRLIIVLIVLMIPVVWLAMANDNRPFLPVLSSEVKEKKIKQTDPLSFNKKEFRKYGGFNDFLKAKKRNAELIKKSKAVPFNQRIRAGFYNNWDPQSFFSLQNYIDKMNVVIPEWFHMDSVGRLVPDIDMDAYRLMKKHPVKIIPLINNINFLLADGTWDPGRLDVLLNDKAKRSRMIRSILDTLKAYDLQGINIDFEELKESSVKPMVVFQKELYDSLHAHNLIVTQDILPNDDNFDPAVLQKYNDYIFLMAYDQHYSTSTPGSVSEQRWIEKTLDEAAKQVPSEKIVLAIAGYGYDWPDGEEAQAITYQQAMAYAKENDQPIDFDDNSYNCSFHYTSDSVKHTVYFVDAAGNYNTMRFADEYGTAGVALWRLGSEDERIWSFFNRDLSNAALAKDPFGYGSLRHINLPAEKPDYIGRGEILNVIGFPAEGEIKIEIDSVENIVTEQDYKTFPIRYVIKRTGVVNNQVILTFDDGPDPEYTPRILNILEQEKVPAAFFIVGINAEDHLPLLRRIYREGYEIGNHTFTHPNMALVSSERAVTEMEATRLLLEANTSHSTILFRAPFNADAEPTKAVELKPIERAREDHYYTVGESIDPEDWDVGHGVNADSIYNRVVRQYELYGGEKGIILLHDAGGNREATVAALPRIIHYFKQRKVQFATIGDILHLSKDEIMPAVHNQVLTLSWFVSGFVYWLGHFLVAAFWLAIVLSLGRIALIGMLSFIQLRRSKKEIAAPLIKSAVSIIVPAYNEEVNAVKTVKNLLQQDYGNIEIIFVDDGSTDATYSSVQDAFLNNPRVKVFTKSNSGKAAALNYGIAQAATEFLICIDADTQLMPDAISRMMKYFTNDNVGAVAGNVKVGNERNMLTRWQSIEYITAQNFDRRAFDLVNCITVVPGAIGAFRKKAVLDAGGFTSDTLAEDCDLTIRILRKGYVVRSASDAIAVTEAPETFRQFMRQRFRWSYGIMQSFWKNKDACFNPKYKTVGMVALPNILLFQILVPVLAPAADLLLILGLIWNRNDPESMNKIFLFYGLFLAVDIVVSFIAFIYEKEKLTKLLWLIPQRFVYRQLMYVILFRSIRKAVKGETQSWGVLKRTGGVKLIHDKSVIGDQ